MAGWTGLEPATFCVTGRRSNQLSYHPVRERAANVLTRGIQVKRGFGLVRMDCESYRFAALFHGFAVVAQLDRAAVF